MVNDRARQKPLTESYLFRTESSLHPPSSCFHYLNSVYLNFLFRVRLHLQRIKERENDVLCDFVSHYTQNVVFFTR